MDIKLYELVQTGLKDASLKEERAEDFAELIFAQYNKLLAKNGFYFPRLVFEDTKNEIKDEILRIYRIKTYGCFNIKSYQEDTAKPKRRAR